MKLNELRNMKVATEMPLGTQEVTFKRIQYRTDAEDNVTGVFVHIEEYRSLYLPFFDNDNYQLDMLLKQLGCDSYAPEDINDFAGVRIIATRYKRGDYTNTSFNPNGNDSETLA